MFLLNQIFIILELNSLKCNELAEFNAVTCSMADLAWLHWRRIDDNLLLFDRFTQFPVPEGRNANYSTIKAVLLLT